MQSDDDSGFLPGPAFPRRWPPSPSVDDDPLPQRIDASAPALASTLFVFCLSIFYLLSTSISPDDDAVPSINDSHPASSLPNDNYNGGHPSLNLTRRRRTPSPRR